MTYYEMDTFLVVQPTVSQSQRHKSKQDINFREIKKKVIGV